MDILIINTGHYSQPVPVIPAGACMVAEAAELAGGNIKDAKKFDQSTFSFAFSLFPFEESNAEQNHSIFCTNLQTWP